MASLLCRRDLCIYICTHSMDVAPRRRLPEGVRYVCIIHLLLLSSIFRAYNSQIRAVLSPSPSSIILLRTSLVHFPMNQTNHPTRLSLFSLPLPSSFLPPLSLPSSSSSPFPFVPVHIPSVPQFSSVREHLMHLL